MSLTIILCFCALSWPAAQQKLLTLPEAIKLSLANSRQLKGSQARIDQASASLRQALGARLPDGSAGGAYMRLNSANVNLKIKSNNNTSGNTNSNNAKINQAIYGIVNLSLPVYAGGRLKYGVESSRYLEEAAILDAENDRESVIINTIDAYNNLFKSRATMTIVDTVLLEARQHVRDYENMEKNGILARNDLLKAQLQLSNTELSLLEAQNNWKLANLNMDLMLGLPENTELLPDSSLLIAPIDNKTIDDYMQFAILERKDLSALDYRKRSALTAVKSVKAERFPGLSLSGGYIALNIPNALVIYNAINIGLGIQYNIGSIWKNKAKVQQAEAKFREIEANEGLLSNSIRLQVYQAYQNYILSEKKINIYATAIEQAEENYKVNHNKFNNGLATISDVLDAETLRVQVRLNKAFATSDRYIAYNKLLQVSGLLAKSISVNK